MMGKMWVIDPNHDLSHVVPVIPIDSNPKARTKRKKDIDREFPQNKELLKIPAFLDRSKWTEKDYERSKRAWLEITREERERLAAEQRAREAEVARGLAMAKAHREQRAKRLSEKLNRQQRREAKEQARIAVLTAVEQGKRTVGQIRKHTGLGASKDIQQALRFLIRAGKISKIAGRKLYTLAWESPPNEEKERKRPDWKGAKKSVKVDRSDV